MNTFLFKKVTGGAKMQRNGLALHGCPNLFDIIYIDLANDSTVAIRTSLYQYQVNVLQDRVTIDKTGVAGLTATYEPGTLTGEQLQDKLIDVFNPFSNVLTV